MRRLWISSLLLASLLPLSAEDWTTEDGKTYKNISVQGQESDGVRITYDGGAGKIPYYELPVDIQRRFGQDIDSLAAKKKAVDQAIDDAVKSAVAAEQSRLPVEPSEPSTPAMNSGPAPGGVPGNATGVIVPPPGGAAPVNTATTPGNTAPGLAPTPGAPGTSPSATAANPAAPGVTPGAPTNVAPGTAANTAAHPAGPAGPGGPAHPAPGEGMPTLMEPMSHTPQPAGVLAAKGKPLELSVANYSYNVSLDVCYLDSPAVDVYLDPPPPTPAPPGQGASLVMRIVTEGAQPQAPDRFEATFLSVGGGAADLSSGSIDFSVDATDFTLDDSARKDSGTLSGGGQAVQYVSFYLTPEQARQITAAKAMSIAVGGKRYKIDEKGASVLRRYMEDVDTLAPASSSFVRSFYKMLGRIPSFFSIISTVCEYVILGSFGLLVAASIAAFILGVTRFIKM
jgi:hypothetical protein